MVEEGRDWVVAGWLVSWTLRSLSANPILVGFEVCGVDLGGFEFLLAQARNA